MKNLDQIRAKNALAAARQAAQSPHGGFRGANDGEVVKKVPTMIRENGILAAAAFALENGAKTGHAGVFNAVIAHLADPEVRKIPQPYDLETFIEWLSEGPAVRLRDITAETMAYLNYLRRFACKKGEPEK